MENGKVYRAIGLMSGTSLDGIDAALIETDGRAHVKVLDFYTAPYVPADREVLRAAKGLRDAEDARVRAAAKLLTRLHVDAVRALKAEGVEIIGFHGQTIAHDPDNHFTLQIGDGAMLARETGIPVIDDFRSADVQAGGQGAPLLPLYHRARAKADRLPSPVAILNIGGVANITYVGESDDEILAFDTGPGIALLDDFIKVRTGQDFDAGGTLARRGHVIEKILEAWSDNPYFGRKPPKSLDRDAWDVSALAGLSDEDGAATLTAFTGECIMAALDHLPGKPRAWYVAGGGRKNRALMLYLSAHLRSHMTNTPVVPVEAAGWNGDATEAEGFAYLAVRSLLGLPLSLPTTTGVSQPQAGGTFHKVS